MPPVELPIRTKQIYGRAILLDQLDKALASRSDHPALLLLTGDGGTGKTRILEALLERLEAQQRLYLPIYDFYHIDRFKASAIEETIIRLFSAQRPATEAIFAPYREAQRQLDSARQSGQAFEQAQAHVRQVFVACYNVLAEGEGERPAVLLFDSVEQAVNLYDGAEQRMAQRAPTANGGGEHWLQEMLPQLQNTVAILSGRPQTLYGEPVELYERMRGQMPTQHIPIDGMDRGAADDFARALREKLLDVHQPDIHEFTEAVDLDDETLQLWHSISGGLPFWIAMLFTCTMFGVTPTEVDQIHEQIRAGESPTLDRQAQQRLRDATMRSFLSQIDANDHILILALQWMATIRKGASDAMLQTIAEAEGVPIDNPTTLAERLGQLLIVKRRSVPRYTFDGVAGEETLLFLHDELYHWLDSDVSGAVQLRPAVSRALIEWYDRTIDAAETARIAAVERLLTVGPEHPEAEALNHAQQDHARRRDMLVLDRLGYYYQFDRERGVAEYNMQSYAAIVRREMGYGVMLRQEALRSHYRLDRGVPFAVEVECAARWLLRATYYEDPEGLGLRDRLGFYWEHEAGASGAHYALLHLAVAELLLNRRPEEREAIQRELAAARAIMGRFETTSNPTSNQWRRMLQSRIHNAAGYSYRMTYDLFDATEEYRQALAYGTGSHLALAQLRGETLNNIAYVYSEQGNVAEARRFALEGLDSRQRYASAYNVALSLNTLARISIRAGQFIMAREYAEQALEIFRHYHSSRGMSLCLPVLAEANRKLAEQLSYMISRQEQAFETAMTLFKEAHELLDKAGITSAERRREVIQGIGCTYRSHGQALHIRGVEPDRAASYFAAAHDWLERAVNLAIEKRQPALIVMDIHEDLATIHVNQDEYDERVEIHLQRAEALAPAEYRFERMIGLRGTRRPVYGFWRELAQCEIQRMMLGFGCYDYGIYTRNRASAERTLIRRGDPSDLQEAGRHLLLMLAYILQYAHSSSLLERANALTLRELRRKRTEKEIKLIATAIYQASRDYRLEDSEARRLAERLIDQAFNDLEADSIGEI
ncbi:ATP-binding protein [Chloroflexales bacterium ZM16-3]|nr:ATP-binding protein [Chloroflexales bacterium ZM16-3]